MTELSFEDWDIGVSPENGACLTFCRYKGQDILRPYARGAVKPFDPILSSGFCLVPFSNRIANGQFNYDNQTVNIARTHPEIQHPIHGFGWQSAWKIVRQSPASLTLVHDYDRGAWPWPYESRQRFHLGGNVLRHELAVTNTGGKAMPTGLGFHPYFTGVQTCLLEFHAEAVWHNNASGLPTKQSAIPKAWDFSKGRAVNKAKLDNVFAGAAPEAKITDIRSGLSIALRCSPNLTFSVVYTAAGDGSFCYEPVSHMTDAVNRKGDLRTGLIHLPPGETVTAWMTYEVGV